MFDKLIESNTRDAEFAGRRSYFMVSALIVGTLFLAAVVISIYAGEIGIGNGDLELSELLAPVETAAVAPEPPEPRTERSRDQQTSEKVTRQVNMQRIDEVPVEPAGISVVPNKQASRPIGKFELGPVDSGPSIGPSTGRNDRIGTGDETGLDPGDAKTSETVKTEVTPPPAIKPRRAVTQNRGVVNGMATWLPKPPYPAPAIAMHVQGKVDVQVTIDETGKVISAKAASGHPLLRAAAEKAAWSARFTPTLLSDVPVKVTGVIVYNFNRS